MGKRTLIYIFAGFLLFGGLLTAQSIRINRVDLTRFPMIRLTVSIETASGMALPADTRRLELMEGGLRIEDFRVQPLDSVELPVYTVVAIDKSGSMKGDPLKKAKQAAAEYIGMMKGDDQCGYIEFDTRVTVAAEFSNDAGQLAQTVNATAAGSDTAFLDAVYRGIQMLSQAPDRAAKIVMVLTDGLDNRSSRPLAQVLEAAAENGVMVYTIGLGQQVDQWTLRQLAQNTNGNYYFSAGVDTLSGIYKTISTLLHSQMQIEYETLFPMDEQWHAIEIRLPRKGKILMARRQYLSARESRIPSDMLKRIRAQQKKRVQESHYRELVKRQKWERFVIIVLAGILCLLVLILALVLWKRRKRM
jgi:VWFA-related protein